jgi:hypothetical protein
VRISDILDPSNLQCPLVCSISSCANAAGKFQQSHIIAQLPQAMLPFTVSARQNVRSMGPVKSAGPS